MTPHDAFVRACVLDVAVRKPGNVSIDSPGHRMQAGQFIASAAAAAGPLCAAGATVGERIEGAVAATLAAAGCNTNLGIVLLCAPIARAAEEPAPLRAAIAGVLAALTPADAAAAYRAIAQARPAGLGRVAQQDVQDVPTIGLRAAMALAADRDRIARQYRDGYAELFDLALPALPRGWTPPALQPGDDNADATTVAAVQSLYLLLLTSAPDSHIVRKHGASVAQIVMAAAQLFRARDPAALRLDGDAGFAAWDGRLKADGINPGTSADLTVAALMLAALGAAGGMERDTGAPARPSGHV